MGYKVDLTGVETRTFEPLPMDHCVAEVSDLVYTAESKRSKAPKVQFIMNAVSDLEGNPVEGNRKLFYEVSLQDQSLWNLKRTLIALGDSEEDLEGEIDIEKEDYVGRQAVAVLYMDDSDAAKGVTGEAKQKVRRLQPMPVVA